MGYTITFYAINGQDFARQMRDSPADLLGRVEQLYRQQTPESESEWDTLRQTAGGIVRNKLPEDCDADWFCVLCWLAGATSERVAICGFEGFRHLSFLDEIAIWPLMLRHAPPFPIPRSKDDYPSVGFLPVEQIEPFALPELAQLPASDDRDVINARDEFRDVLESLVPDHLDLLAVLL